MSDEKWKDIEEIIEFERMIAAMQLFDPPLTGSLTVAGRPIWRIPDSEKKYPDFITWWTEVGRFKPADPQGWGAVSGSWVMLGRVEIIPPDQWEALPENERSAIELWAQNLPTTVSYDDGQKDHETTNE
jgi:hypothetical protein